MEELSVLLTFAVGLAGALVFGYIALRLKLSPIIGYLLAGIAVGPFTPGVVVNWSVAEQFAEIGVILLLFGIGLRFHLRELIAVLRIVTAHRSPFGAHAPEARRPAARRNRYDGLLSKFRHLSLSFAALRSRTPRVVPAYARVPAFTSSRTAVARCNANRSSVCGLPIRDTAG